MPNPRTSLAAAAALVFLLHIVTVAPSSATDTDVHDVLPKYGLPKGLLPDSARTYSLSDDGTFEIELERACYMQFTDLVYYAKKITGKLSYGAISDLSGIQVKKFFTWFPVTGIKASSNVIELQVGFLSEKLPANLFEQIRTCKAKAFRADLLLGASVAEV